MLIRKHSINAFVLVILGVLFGADCHQIFDNGKEYRYSYLGLFTTGIEEHAPLPGYASAYILLGTLRVQGENGNSFIAKLENMRMGMYNGRWSYFPIPQFGFFEDPRLSSLEEPFKITLTEDGKFKSLTMNDQDPEYASNLKRGLATYLQMNLSAGFDSMQIFKEPELTTMGDCPTAYEIFPPSTSSSFAKIGKYRNHVDCPDVPRRTRKGMKTYYRCSSDKTRDLLNSTSYASYDIALEGNNPTINKVTVFSSILYWPFTSGKKYLYTWFNVTLALTEVVPIQTQISPPVNPETHEDLTFIFEQSDYQDPEEDTPDLKTLEPFYFHQREADIDEQTTEKLIEKAKETISQVAESLAKNVDEFKEDFHSNSPTTISLALSYLDHSSLKLLYEFYSSQSNENDEKKSQLQLFLDGLVLAGTSASSTIIRDLILEQVDDKATLWRLLFLFPNYIQTPSETLAKEFDSVFDLLKTSRLNKTMKRTLEFSLATLISRSCERNECASTGILDKYVNYFETNLNGATNFDDKTSALLGLRNLQIGKSLDKVLEIALGNIVTDKAVRVQAIWSLRPLFYKNPEKTMQSLLKVFYNRTESCEIRTSVFGLIMSVQPNERVLHEIAYFMWSETCPQTLNIVRSTLTHLSKSVGPCTKMSSYARTILKYLPPGSVDPTRTTSYAMEYFDESSGMGRSTYATIQKSGKTALPISIFFGTSQTIGGYSISPIGIFIRLEGLGKFIPQSLIAGNDEDAAEKILKSLMELKVKLKVNTPLKLEFTLMYSNRVIYHKALDTMMLYTSIQEVTQEIQIMMGVLKSSKSFLWERSILIGETLHQQPLEVGIPVSIYTSSSQIHYLKSKMSPLSPTDTTRGGLELDFMYKANTYATTTISNHVPIFNTRHSAGLLRTLRIQSPRHFGVRLSKTSDTYDFTVYPPPADSPFIIQTHATSFTSISNDNPTKGSTSELLQKSCPNCENFTFVSSGPEFSNSDEVISIPVPNGMSSGVKKFMCEKHISKSQFMHKVQDFFGSKGKNYGIFDTTYAKLNLALQQLVDHFFYWPNAEPCGFQIYYRKNPPSYLYALQKVEGSQSFGFPSSLLKGEFKLTETLKLSYEGLDPPTPKTVVTQLKISNETPESQEIHIKFSIDGQADGQTLVGCFGISNQANLPPTDPLGFEGENEPKLNQSISFSLGKVKSAESGTQCPKNLVDISITGKAERSPEQIAEVKQSRDLSYILCNLERESGHWPKTYLPPTQECYTVFLDQTELRNVNLSIHYKVAKEVGKRLTRPLLFIGNLLSPFLLDPDQDKVQPQRRVDQVNYVGSIEIDVNLKKQDPVMNIMFVGSNEQRQHQDVDFDLIPNALKIKPAPGRFAPSTKFLYKAGFTGMCAFTSSYLVTFDNLKYAAKFRECETLVVADCREFPNFAIYAKVVESKLFIRVAIAKEEFIISDGKVTSNAQDVTFDSNGDFSKGDIVFKKKGKDITVKSIQLGIEVRFAGGEFVQVNLRSTYRGVTCGLCGDFDTTSTNDFQGPSTPVCSLSSVVDSWTLKSGTCKQLESVC